LSSTKTPAAAGVFSWRIGAAAFVGCPPCTEGAADLAERNPYAVLGVSPAATAAEIKAAYRTLVKRHHPDAGGDEVEILALNAAWELLGDAERRRQYDRLHATRLSGRSSAADPAGDVGSPVSARAGKPSAAAGEQEMLDWLQQIYAPIDRQLAQVINPFPAQLKALAADPYDDTLMEAFCRFLETSQARLVKVEALYRSRSCPAGVERFSLDLYHCLSLVNDALSDLERYTMGYVDSYLRDGRELLRKAKAWRSQLQLDSRHLRR
jgi:molecular chaperone DnaJ